MKPAVERSLFASSKLSSPFSTFPPRTVPKRVSTFHKMLGSKAALKILLFLNSDMAIRKGRSFKAILKFCSVPQSQALSCLKQLEAQGLVARKQNLHSVKPVPRQRS